MAGFPQMSYFDPVMFGIELGFTLVAVVFCFLIYFKTKEIYELTKYKGIKYFRGAFLFFGLSYVMRFLFSLVLLSKIAFDFFLPRHLVMPFFILPLGYLSTIGIFYLIFSSVWKRFNNKNMLFVGHTVAIVLSLASFATRSHFILVLLQCVLLLVAVILRICMGKERRGLSQIKVLYFLVAFLWLINLLVLGRRRPYSLEIEVSFQVISLFVFVLIYYKISKWVK